MRRNKISDKLVLTKKYNRVTIRLLELLSDCFDTPKI